MWIRRLNSDHIDNDVAIWPITKGFNTLDHHWAGEYIDVKA